MGYAVVPRAPQWRYRLMASGELRGRTATDCHGCAGSAKHARAGAQGVVERAAAPLVQLTPADVGGLWLAGNFQQGLLELQRRSGYHGRLG